MEEARRPQRPAEPSRGSPPRSSRGAGRREGWAEPSSPGPPQTRVAPQSPGRGAPGPSAPSRSALPRGEGGARRGNRPRSRGRWKRGRVPAGGRPARSHWRRFLPRGTPTRCGFLEVPRALAPQSPDSRPRLPAPPSPAPRPAPSVGPGARAPPALLSLGAGTGQSVRRQDSNSSPTCVQGYSRRRKTMGHPHFSASSRVHVELYSLF